MNNTDLVVQHVSDQDVHSISKERLRLWLRLLQVNKIIENEIREFLRTEHDTTLPRFDVMAALYKMKKGAKMSELSQALMVSNGNVTGIIDRLVTEGLVIRAAIEGDRRSTRVQLTNAGKKRFEKQAAAHEAKVNELFSAVNYDDAAGIITRLDRLVHEKGE
ncbi:MarR family winged helix-turn-helix transcriptional regulator [Kordiimonas pumila]|uniref:MarR family winged helix-turn-helix transcriptional regulator n=1 Tax=Kordiimonas pumila TaxID=2161677 RepID=A0ABV7D0N8_9PROT|nr:MarR family transcriptional regulator [Kordiimonas pumila]